MAVSGDIFILQKSGGKSFGFKNIFIFHFLYLLVEQFWANHLTRVTLVSSAIKGIKNNRGGCEQQLKSPRLDTMVLSWLQVRKQVHVGVEGQWQSWDQNPTLLMLRVQCYFHWTRFLFRTLWRTIRITGIRKQNDKCHAFRAPGSGCRTTWRQMAWGRQDS